MIRLFGSFAVFLDVSFFFIPDILAQKEAFLPASFLVLGFGAGGLRFIPCFFADALPFAFNPPFGFLPSFLCQAGDFAIRLSLFLNKFTYAPDAKTCRNGDKHCVGEPVGTFVQSNKTLLNIWRSIRNEVCQ